MAAPLKSRRSPQSTLWHNENGSFVKKTLATAGMTAALLLGSATGAGAAPGVTGNTGSIGTSATAAGSWYDTGMDYKTWDACWVMADLWHNNDYRPRKCVDNVRPGVITMKVWI